MKIQFNSIPWFIFRRGLLNLPSMNSLKTHQEKYIIGHSREQMYEIVTNIQDYKLFLPWCQNSYFVGSGSPKSERAEAVLDIGYQPFIESYKSVVTFKYPVMAKAVCKDGRLFKHLETLWLFHEVKQKNVIVPNVCRLEYQLRFETSLSMVTAAVNSLLFDAVAKEMVNAFLKRARHIHGPPVIQPRKLG